MSSFSLLGKVCVVTGGSRGLGREIVLAFASAQAEAIVVASRKLGNCKALAEEVEREFPHTRCLAVACNASSWDSCTELFTTTITTFGRCDVLVNNAGASPLYPSLADVTERYWDKVVGLNMKGPFRLCALFGAHACERASLEQGWGEGEGEGEGKGGGERRKTLCSIINVSTVGTQKPTARETVYAAAKYGVEYLTAAFANAYGPHVRCNCIRPGSFLTDISKAWDMKTMRRIWAANVPAARGGLPEEIAGAALYLASDASSYTTGAVLTVDGGAGKGSPGMWDPRARPVATRREGVRPLPGGSKL